MTLQYQPAYATAIAPILALMANAPKIPSGDVDGRRVALEGFFGVLLGQAPDAPSVIKKVHHTTAKDGHQVAITSFMPPESAAPVAKTSAVLYLHGGGMIAGSVKIYEKSIAVQAATTGVPYFAVEYRLAPEYPHPVPSEDCFAGLEWLYANAAQFNVDTSRIGVMGDSAGGGLAAGIALLARDRKITPPLAKQILIYPMLDDRNTKPYEWEGLATWNSADNITGWGALLGDAAGKEGVSPYAAPARAENVSGLPSTFIDVGMLDLFCDEDMLYARKLVQAGVDVELHVYRGVPHAFEAMGPTTEVAQQAWQLRATAVKSF